MKNLYKIVIEKPWDAIKLVNSSYSDFISEIYSPLPLLNFKAKRKVNFFLFLIGISIFLSALIFQYWVLEYYKINLSGISEFQIIFAIPFSFIITILIISISLIIIYIVKVYHYFGKFTEFINDNDLKGKFVFFLETDSDLNQVNLIQEYNIEYLEKLQ